MIPKSSFVRKYGLYIALKLYQQETKDIFKGFVNNRRNIQSQLDIAVQLGFHMIDMSISSF